MPSTVTLSVLTSRARQRADMTDFSFLTDAEVQVYLQSSAKALYELILSAWGDDYYYDTDTFSTVAQCRDEDFAKKIARLLNEEHRTEFS